jgi:hypothetical protein
VRFAEQDDFVLVPASRSGQRAYVIVIVMAFSNFGTVTLGIYRALSLALIKRGKERECDNE